MAQAYQTPCAADVRPTAAQASTEPTRCLDLATHGFHDDLAPGVPRLSCRGAHWRRHTLWCRLGRLKACRRQRMMPLALRGHVGIAPSVRQRWRGCLTVRPPVQGRHARVRSARRTTRALHACIGQRGQRRPGQRRRLWFVVGRVGPLTGPDALTRPVSTGWRMPTVLPAWVLGGQARQLGSGAMGLRCVLRGLCSRLGRFASPWRTRPPPRGLAVRCRLRLGLSPAPGRLDRGSTSRTAGPRGGSCVPATASQRGLIGLVLLRGVRHQRLDGLTQACHGCLPLSVAHRLVP